MDLRPTLLLVAVVAALGGCCFLLKICRSPQTPTRRKTFVPQPMMDLFHLNQRQGATPAATVVRGVLPAAHVWVPGSGRLPPRHLLDFQLPSPEAGETLISAQLKVRARPSGRLEGSVRAWVGAVPLVAERRAFRLPRATWFTLNVTSALPRLPQLPLSVAVSAHGALQVVSGLQPPLLVLEYAEESPPVRRPRRDTMEAEEYEEETNQVWNKPTRTRTLRSSCRRRPLYVDFAEIQYDRWIVAPSGYEAFQCSGKCSWPVSDHLTPTKHAIVQALVHSVSPGKAVKACCVPTSLEPISVLYVDHRGIVTYRYGYRDMVVTQCGCR